MKFSYTLNVMPLLLASGAAVVDSASLMSTARTAALVGYTITKDTMSKANVPGALGLVNEKSREFITESLPQATVQGAQWVAANPSTTAVCGAAGVGLLLFAAPAVVAGPALGAIGFGTSGIAAGSVAAGIQSGIGNVVAPSIFATLQSAGAGGYGVSIVYPAIQVAGGLVASSAGAAASWAKSKL